MKYQDLINQMTLEEKASLVSGKDFWQTQNIDRLGIPSIFLADGPHGIRKQAAAADHLGLNESLKATCFPTAATMANSWNLELGREMGECLSVEAKKQNVNVLLGPGINIKRNPRCGRNFEYFSEDPYLAGKMASMYIQGIQSQGISGCVKHFVANNQELRRMTVDSVMDERTLREIYLTNFEIAIKEGKPYTIMSSYNLVNGQYANENQHTCNDILRGEWGFKGVMVSDWGGANDHLDGLKAFNELEMPTTDGDTTLEIIKAVEEGRLDESLLDENVDHLLELIFKTHEALNNGEVELDIEKHHEVAQKCAEESLVLLENDGVLPLKDEKVAFIGKFIEQPRYQGAGSSVVNPFKLDSVMECLSNYSFNSVGYAPGFDFSGKVKKGLIKKALELAKKADVVIVFAGLDNVTEAEGIDRSNILLPKGQLALIDELLKLNKKVVVCLSCGAVVELPFAKKVNALLHCYLTGQAGAKAILNILSGKVNPSGKLAETYLLSYDDTPSKEYFHAKECSAEYREGLFVGYRYFDKVNKEVLYPFGYGLSYTTFEYSDLTVDSEGAHLTITNNGNYDGKEIAQMYIGLENSKIFRAVKELKGFVKVDLKKGESKKVTIPFDEYSFRYFNVKTNKWEVEEGEYTISIGSSSKQILLIGTIKQTGTTDVLPYEADLLPSYYNGDPAKVSEDEFKVLYGKELPSGEVAFVKKNRINVDYYTTVDQLKYARGWTGRLFSWAIRFAIGLFRFLGNPTLANTLIMGVQNQPMRALSRMTGGAIHWAQLDGLIYMFNGHFFGGLNRFLKAGGEIKRKRKLEEKERKKMEKEQERLKKEEEKRLRNEEKARIKAMSKEERKAYYESLRQQKLDAFATSELEHDRKVEERRANIINENRWNRFWFNFGQSGFCQYFRRGWAKFSFLHPELSKLVYQLFFFLVFSNGVTIWQYLVMLFLPNLLGLDLARIPFVWPEFNLGMLNGKPYIAAIFNEPVIQWFINSEGKREAIAITDPLLYNMGDIGGGLGNFIAFEIAVFTAQCINFPLQRNITFKSKGNVWWQMMWYFIGWILISIFVNAVWGFINPLMICLNVEKALSDLLKTFITGGLSMFVFFFIFKIIFPEGEKNAN